MVLMFLFGDCNGGGKKNIKLGGFICYIGNAENLKSWHAVQNTRLRKKLHRDSKIRVVNINFPEATKKKRKKNISFTNSTHTHGARMSAMITATAWVPRGFAAQFPTRKEFDEEEFERIAGLARGQLDDAREELAAEQNGEEEENEGKDVEMEMEVDEDGGVKLTEEKKEEGEGTKKE